MITFDKDVRYTRTNEWAKKLDDVIRVGIDDYSQSSLGDIVHIVSPHSLASLNSRVFL